MTMTKQKVVAVTACPTGIAHTFMAANKIIAWAKAHNIEVKVETQGSDGVKNRLTKQDIASATAIILATDGNAVNLLMTILICSHSILVTSG